MPAATSYTETTLAVYIRNAILRETADALGWTTTTVPNGDYDEIIGDIERYMSVDDVANLPSGEIVHMELVAAVQAWRAAVAAFVPAYNISGGGSTGSGLARTMERGQLFTHAQQALILAEDALKKFETVETGVDTAFGNGLRSSALRVKPVWYPKK